MPRLLRFRPLGLRAQLTVRLLFPLTGRSLAIPYCCPMLSGRRYSSVRSAALSPALGNRSDAERIADTVLLALMLLFYIACSRYLPARASLAWKRVQWYLFGGENGAPLRTERVKLA